MKIDTTATKKRIEKQGKALSFDRIVEFLAEKSSKEEQRRSALKFESSLGISAANLIKAVEDKGKI